MAGLLDSLFNPATYGGQNGGLLDFMRNTQMQQNSYQPSGGFAPSPAPQPQSTAQPIMVGNTQMPRIGDAAQFDPQQVNLPQNAQPVQGQMTMSQAATSPSILERIGSMARPDSIVGRVFGGAGRNQTEQALVARGLDPVIARNVASNPSLLRSVLPSLMGTSGLTDDIKEYQFAKREEPGLRFQQFMQRKRATSGEYGLTPIWGTGPDGKPAYIQPGKSGDARLAKLPEGFEIARNPIKIEGPTGTTILDPQTRQVVQFIPKDVAGAASAKAEGSALGEAKAAYDSMSSKMPGLENVVKKLDDLSEKATYTIGGQIIDFGMRQAGMEPREAAIARAQYTSMVDNQILPLLRDTFGAAFTQKEGDTLRATLGDPDKSPTEKQAILKSFIEQKRRDIEALAQRTGRSGVGSQAPTVPATTSAATDLKKKYGLD